jgi:hypothetical protein
MVARNPHGLDIRAWFLGKARDARPYLMPDRWRIGPIWQYWHLGGDDCPPIIRECLDSARRHLP